MCYTKSPNILTKKNFETLLKYKKNRKKIKKKIQDNTLNTWTEADEAIVTCKKMKKKNGREYKSSWKKFER